VQLAGEQGDAVPGMVAETMTSHATCGYEVGSRTAFIKKVGQCSQPSSLR